MRRSRNLPGVLLHVSGRSIRIGPEPCIAAISSAVCAADADKAWPDRAVRVITTPPGSSPDVVARALADVFTKRWKQPVIVENRSSGADMILVARGFLEAQDGHTLLLAPHSLLTVNPLLHATLP